MAELEEEPLPIVVADDHPVDRDGLAVLLGSVPAGRSDAQIAATLYLSRKTVRNNVSNVLTKLQVTDRAQAIVRAREVGLGR